MERFVHDTQTALGCHTRIYHSGHLSQTVFTSFSRNNKPSGWVLTGRNKGLLPVPAPPLHGRHLSSEAFRAPLQNVPPHPSPLLVSSQHPSPPDNFLPTWPPLPPQHKLQKIRDAVPVSNTQKVTPNICRINAILRQMLFPW